MASLNCDGLDINDIRIIFCLQGFNIEGYQFVIKEIGFWCNGISGSIPFNSKINKNQIDYKNQLTINALEEKVHGIKIKKNSEFGLAQSEIKAVLKTLYQMGNNCNGKYIGICRDVNINGLLHKAGLGRFVVNLDNLNIFKSNNATCPSNEDLQILMKAEPTRYTVCNLHEKLMIDKEPICAKVKAQYIAEYCKGLQNYI